MCFQSGIVGCIWFFFWMYLCYDSPAKHPRITEQERVFIEKAIGSTARYKKVDLMNLQSIPLFFQNWKWQSITLFFQRYPTPWGKIFTSTHVWATIVAHFCNNWGYYTLLTTLPTYMRQVLKFDISQVSDLILALQFSREILLADEVSCLYLHLAPCSSSSPLVHIYYFLFIYFFSVQRKIRFHESEICSPHSSALNPGQSILYMHLLII